MNKPNNIKILGIPVSTLNKKTVFFMLEKKLLSHTTDSMFVATINPSFIVKSQSKKEFKNLLINKTQLNVPDGIGIQLAGEYLKRYSSKNLLLKIFGGGFLGFSNTLFNKSFNVIPQKITGVELTSYLLSVCQRESKRVLFIHRSDGLTPVKTIKSFVKSKYPNLTFDIREVKLSEYKKPLNVSKYDLLLCGLGEIKQEIFISNNIGLIKPNIAIGIGGTFDVLTSNGIDDPVTFLDSYGLSWLERLIKNPRRIKKIITSVIIFPILIFVDSVLN